MINTAKIEKQLEAVYSLLEKLTPAEREIITDKLLAYLLFHTKMEQVAGRLPEERKSGRKKTTPISKKDQELLKKIADKTDELYKRLGGDTI